MIQGLFRELNRKVGSEWTTIKQQIAQTNDNDNLTDEMKTESILRQLTYSSVSLVTVLLDSRQELARSDGESNKDELPISSYITKNDEVLAPVLLFCNTCLGVRDTRSVTAIARVLRFILPLYVKKSPIHDYLCDDVLKSAITSLHDPYFVDCQRDLSSLIAGVIHLDDEVPRSIILSLPGMSDSGWLDKRLARLHHANRSDDRLQRSIVLDMLSSVRGIGIHEQGKIELPKPKPKPTIQEQYMSVDQPVAIVRGTSPGLDGVANLFGES